MKNNIEPGKKQNIRTRATIAPLIGGTDYTFYFTHTQIYIHTPII